MEGFNLKKLLGTRLVIALFLCTLLGIPIAQIFVQSRPVAAAGTYSWASANEIKNGNTTFIQVTVDDTNKPLILPSDLMVLESLTTNNTCTNTGGNVNRDGPVGPNGGLTVKDNSSTGSSDASFGRGDLLVVQPYTTAGTATLVQFPNVFGEACAPRKSTVNLANKAGATWTDSQHIKYINDTYNYKSINGNTMTLTGPSVDGCAASTIAIGDNTSGYQSAKTAQLTTSRFIESGAGGSCQNSTITIQMTNQYISGGVGTTGHWIANATDPNAAIVIDSVGADATTFVNKGDTYLESSKNPISGQDMTLLFPSTCKTTPDNTMHVNPYADATFATISAIRDNGHGCATATLTVALQSPYGGDSTTTTTGGNPTTTSDGCNVPTTNEPLRWIECPVISTLQGFASAINGFIGQQLSVPNGIFFNDGTQKVFNIFRNIGVAMLVLAGLIMVVSQAADLELFAAHTVRKALPRLIIVAILISISWPLLQFIIGFFNDIGFWTGKIILSITSYTNVGGGDAGTIMSNIADGLILGLVAAGGIVLLGAGGIISLLVSFILFTIIGVFVLMIREIIILLCILITPLALASFVLPGTEKIGKFWQDTLITTLVMFPLIEGFLASGTALASIILSVKSGDYGYHIVAMLVFIAPYMALPFAFKLAGGLIGRVIEFAEGTHNKTIESRLQGYRQNQTAKNLAATKAGSRWNPNSRWTTALGGRSVNFLGRHVGAGMRGRFGIGAVGSAGMANNMALSADAASKMDTNFAAQMNNEEAMAAVAFGNNRGALSRLTYFNARALATGSARTQIEQTVQNRERLAGRAPLTGAALDNAINTEAATMANNRLTSALAAGQTIQASQQMQTAAADALVRSGKVLENRDEFGAMVDSISHGNASLAAGQRGALQYTARQIGRADWGRGSDYEALQEMDMGAVARQKPKALENLFGSNKVTVTPQNPTGSAVVDAINGSRDANERQHFADILFAAQYNQSVSPQQQKSIAEAINVIRRHPVHGAGGSGSDLMRQAASNYRDKFTPPSDRRLKHDIHHLGTLTNGIKLYSFQYNWGGPQYVGVMAQDLLDTHPAAVVTDDTGYYRVRYDILGLEMVTLEQWQAAQNTK